MQRELTYNKWVKYIHDYQLNKYKVKYTQKMAEKSGAMLLDELREQEDIMRDNQIIAEFMGIGKEYEVDINTKTLKSYNTSWDWLMPVHQKCMLTNQFTGDDQLRTLLIDAVIDADIDRLYKAVVEFINQHNK